MNSLATPHEPFQNSPDNLVRLSGNYESKIQKSLPKERTGQVHNDRCTRMLYKMYKNVHWQMYKNLVQDVQECSLQQSAAL